MKKGALVVFKAPLEWCLWRAGQLDRQVPYVTPKTRKPPGGHRTANLENNKQQPST